MPTVLVHPDADDRVARFRRHAFTVGLVGLLLAEILVLTNRFDTQALVDSGQWWGPLLGYLRYLPQGLMAMAAAALVLGYARQRSTPEPTLASTPSRPWAWLYLAAHLAAFAGLAALTRAVWEGPLGRSPLAVFWVSTWLGLGLVCLLLLAAAAQPAATWAAVARRGAASGVLTAAVVAGVGACLTGRLAGTALWQPLGTATLWAVRGVLGLIFRNVVFEPAASVVGTFGFRVEVRPECSGYEGIGLVWVFLAVYLWFFRRELRFPQAFWLLPIGTVVMWLANVARIAALIVIGATLSPKIALGGFHSQAGWLAFNAVALGLVAVSRRIRLFGNDPAGVDQASKAATGVSPVTAHLAPLLVLVASVMVTTALSSGGGVDLLYPVRVVAVAATLWVLRRAHEPWCWRAVWSLPAVAIGAAVFLIWMALEPWHTAAAALTSTDLAADLARLPRALAWSWLALRVLGSVVFVPIAEELAFRGYLTRRLIAADFTTVTPGRFTWVSFLLSSAAFGALHGRFFAGTIAGLFYALAYYRRGRLSDPILAHAITNALIANAVLTTGAWSLWG